MAALTVSRTEHLSTGFRYLGPFLTEAARAVHGRIHGWSKSETVTVERARAFFESRSLAKAGAHQDDIIALGSLPYRKLLESEGARIRSLRNDEVVLDYGCGPAALSAMLRQQGFGGIYVGADIDRVRISWLKSNNKNPNNRFIDTDEMEVAFDLAIICNVFVYNQDDIVANILIKLRSLAKPMARIVVLEPWPQWYWEFVFDGMHLCARKPRKIGTMLEAAGWSEEARVLASLFSFRAKPWVPIAYCISAYASERRLSA